MIDRPRVDELLDTIEFLGLGGGGGVIYAEASPEGPADRRSRYVPTA
ncbi:MAG: hypothetical protein KF767_19170 [Bdellovibrionaceae bacterium]|nr:hypothetical protein [Pseudobdellovibrionaceae bacterium]